MTATEAVRPVTVAPCAHCPFRVDVPIYLRADRRADIADALRRGESFLCHRTTVPDAEDDSERTWGSASQVCAGAVRSLAATGGTMGFVRMASRVDRVDYAAETAGADVWDLNRWTRLDEGDTADTVDDDEDLVGETCHVANQGCESPAGYLTGAGAVAVDGELGPDDSCPFCGEPTCANCMTGDVCDLCADELEDDDDAR